MKKEQRQHKIIVHPTKGLGLKTIVHRGQRAKVDSERVSNRGTTERVAHAVKEIDWLGKYWFKSLELALKSKARVVQIATWNDWGEGTIIEPSCEFGYRDLEIVQQVRRRQVGPQFAAMPNDLRLPLQIYKQRCGKTEKRQTADWDRIAKLISAGAFSQARSELTTIRP